MTLGVTLLFIYMIPFFVYNAFQGVLLVTTYNEETLYLTNAEEIDPDGDVHSIRGCEALPCRESNTVYFRVRPTLMTHTYAMWDHFGLFFPDRTASVVSPGVSECQVKSYGIRLKFLMRRFDVYPDMLDTICQPLSQNQG